MIATGASGPVVHRLVQEAVRNRLRPDQTAKWSEAAVRLMTAAFPFVEDDPATWAASGELLGHASAAAQYADQQASAETAAALHDHLGTYLRTRGEFVRARQAHERALAIDERAYGPEHPNVAIGINNLGLVLRDQGNLAGARAAFERALAIAKLFYGSKHPTVRLYRSDLSALKRTSGS